MESFYRKNSNKTSNKSAVIKKGCVVSAIQVENQHPSTSFTFYTKKIKEILRTRLSGSETT